METTHRLATHGEEVIMKFFAILSSVVATALCEAQLPIAAEYLPHAGLYNGHVGYATPYAAAYAQDARFAYGQPITALNAGPLTAGPVAAAGPAAYTATVVAAAAPVVAAAAPVAYNAAPVVAAAAPAVPAVTSSQFQAQDEAGNLAYGYQNINSAKQERGNTYGGVEGSYTYVDEAGVHTVSYIADDLGFRVVGDNHPVAPINSAVAPVYAGVAPVAVVDTPAVAEAKAAFFSAYDAVAHREKRSAQYAPYAAAPAAVAYAAAPAREAVLTTIKLNPGHAVFYRVD